MKHHPSAFFIFVTASALLGACEERKESNHVATFAQNTIMNVRHSLSQGRSGYSHNENRQAFVDLIDNIPDVGKRVELADLYIKSILDFDLLALPYRYRACSTIYYFEYLEMALKVMQSANFSDRQIMDVFFKCLSKYKKVCIGTPLVPKMDEESLTDYSWRSDCAKKLYEEYAQRMSEIQRFWMPDLAKYLPKTVHDEFKSRITPFLRMPDEHRFFAALKSKCNTSTVVKPVLTRTKLKSDTPMQK